MANQVTLTFGGDADQLVREAARAQQATSNAGAAATEAGAQYERSAAQSRDLATRMGALGAATEGASGAIGDAAGVAQGLADISTYAERKAQELARANHDLAQAQQDVNQAMLDGEQATRDVAQAGIDAEQAVLDEAIARKELAAAIREHGKGSDEAKQAAIDLKQAQEDSAQAAYDVKQANADATQSLLDVKDAQLNANDAMMAANPPELQKWADQLNMISPILQGVVAIIALITAAQWAWNAAMIANPIGLVIAGIALLIGAIVLIATKTDWFQTAWSFSWGVIKASAQRAWDFIKKIPDWTESAFRNIANVIMWPYKTAFNAIARAWNATVGALSFSVPTWVPGLGGRGWDVPNIPVFHQGGRVPGMPGQDVLIMAQAGETVTPAGGAAPGSVLRIDVAGDREVAAFVRSLIRDYRLLDSYA